VKLALSLWNAECGFLPGMHLHLDADRTALALALRMVTPFASRSEDAELVGAGHRFCRDYPHLWEVAEAGDAAKEKTSCSVGGRGVGARPCLATTLGPLPSRCRLAGSGRVVARSPASLPLLSWSVALTADITFEEPGCRKIRK
jgi:hypothetical protein